MDEMRESLEVQEQETEAQVQEQAQEEVISQASVQEEPETITIETLQEMLGEVGKKPEVEKGVETEGEEGEDEGEEVDFSILGEALYSIYAQGLRWATYILLSRIIPGYENEVLDEVSLPRSAQRQLVKAFNRFLQKKFDDWSIKLSEEGLVLSLMMLYSITYIGQAMMLAYQIRRMQQAYQVQIKTEEEEEPKPKRSSRRKSSSSRSRSGRRGGGRRKKGDNVATDGKEEV
jgi:hypothetical protein